VVPGSMTHQSDVLQNWTRLRQLLPPHPCHRKPWLLGQPNLARASPDGACGVCESAKSENRRLGSALTSQRPPKTELPVLRGHSMSVQDP